MHTLGPIELAAGVLDATHCRVTAVGDLLSQDPAVAFGHRDLYAYILPRFGTIEGVWNHWNHGVVPDTALLAAKPAGPAASTIQYWK